MKISSFVAGLAFVCLGFRTFAQPHSEPSEALTLEQQVGQVFIWTYGGTTFTPQLRTLMQHYQPGALIAFARNIHDPVQIGQFNASVQRWAAEKQQPPLFLMIDQEGGVVTRLHTHVPLPSALALGKMHDADFIRSFARTQAQLLRQLGFNMNLAPVMDVSSAQHDSFIGNRAFSADPEVVTELAGAYAQGSSEGGMIPTAKHFPGHGGVAQDSHHTLPRKLATYEELSDHDLRPFEEFADEDYPRAIMVAHLALPNVDPTGLPATYSDLLLNTHLRGDLKFDGLVITDDLEMGGASIDNDIGERAVRAFLAGNDMLMLAGSLTHQKRAFSALLSAVKSGRISEARLRKSVNRILAYKSALKLGPFTLNHSAVIAAMAKVDLLSRQVLKTNFTQALATKPAGWTSDLRQSTVLVMSSERHFFSGFKSKFAGHAEFFHLSPQSLPTAAQHLADQRYKVAVFYASGNQTARWLNGLSSELRAKVVVINANDPGGVENQGSFLTVLNINSHNPDCGEDLAMTFNDLTVRKPSSEAVDKASSEGSAEH